MQVLIVAATQPEVQPLISHFCLQEQDKGRFYSSEKRCVLITGVGMTATTYALTKHLATKKYDLVINAGIAGAFDKGFDLGEVVQISTDCFAELGAEDGEDFIDIFSMGFVNANHFPFAYGRLMATHSYDDLPKTTGITVNKVHGEADSIAAIEHRLQPQLESMEGAAALYVCLQERIPCAQIRAVSNYVERRNRAAWDIPLAIKNLNELLINKLSTD